MQHIIEGFLNFQKEIFPQRKELLSQPGIQPESQSAFHLLFR